ncbi:MAG TPA: transposase [Burkholderiales bacterium]|nr:transposase [Burkholderiales bacterium]
MTATQHVIQRSRAACFSCADDRVEYLRWLCACSEEHECAVHAYALMANHVHFLVTAANGSGGSDLAQALCERYQQYVREQYEGEGVVWDRDREIRPVHARRYLLACMRYIELNPVRAHVVDLPADYRWSSFRANALGHDDPIVTPHPLYYALGRSPETRRRAYANFVRRGFARPDRASP